MDRSLIVIAKQLGFRAVARDVVEDDDVSSYVVVKLRRFYEKNSKNTDALARLLVNVLTMLPRSTAENIEHHIGVVAYMGLDATDDEFDDGVEDENERHGYEVYGKDAKGQTIEVFFNPKTLEKIDVTQ